MPPHDYLKSTCILTKQLFFILFAKLSSLNNLIYISSAKTLRGSISPFARTLRIEIMSEILVGGAFLSGFINVVFERLLSPQVVNLIRGKKLDQELIERLKTALCAAESLLLDAEQKQMGNPLVRNWVDTLRDAVYVADDLLDRVFTKAATTQKGEVITTN